MSERHETLAIRNLRLDVAQSGNDIVDEVTLTIARGEMLGLVGESGSGKTTVGLAVLGHARKGVGIHSGTVSIEGTDVLAAHGKDLRRARGRLVSYVPQDPGTALNPALRIGGQVLEVLQTHGFGADNAARKQRVQEVFSEVLLPATPSFLRRYPHQLSGGQQQRVGLAMAFAARPAVIVLDEPTTGLDVSTQAHVLETVRALASKHGVAALYVTHDLAVVATLADRVAVMYAGRIVEQGTTAEIFANPAHPYTRYLVAAAPEMGSDRELVGLAGRAPSPGRRPVGCAFALRCEVATAECHAAFPEVTNVGTTDSHEVRCFHAFTVPERTSRRAAAGVAAAAGNDAALSLRGVDAAYTGLSVVHDVSFDISRGECVALVGESGSGKSTLSRLAHGAAQHATVAHRWPVRRAIGRCSSGCPSSTSSRTPTARCTHADPSPTRSGGHWQSPASTSARPAARLIACSSGSRSAPAMAAASPTSCRVASANGWRSRERWSANRRC